MKTEKNEKYVLKNRIFQLIDYELFSDVESQEAKVTAELF